MVKHDNAGAHVPCSLISIHNVHKRSLIALATKRGEKGGGRTTPLSPSSVILSDNYRKRTRI